jgi:hypothetical protein
VDGLLEDRSVGPSQAKRSHEQRHGVPMRYVRTTSFEVADGADTDAGALGQFLLSQLSRPSMVPQQLAEAAARVTHAAIVQAAARLHVDSSGCGNDRTGTIHIVNPRPTHSARLVGSSRDGERVAFTLDERFERRRWRATDTLERVADGKLHASRLRADGAPQ